MFQIPRSVVGGLKKCDHIRWLIFFCVVVIFSVGLVGEAKASWYDSNWGYRKPITISNNTASALTNFQVSVAVTFVASMNIDFSDLRFTASDGTTLLNSWLEAKTNSASATVWVKIPSIPASDSATIYMYYGNGNATDASNIDNTFLFGDDFPGTSLDTDTKWSVKTGGFGGEPTVSGGIMSLTTYLNGIDSKTFTLPGDTILEASVKIGNAATWGRALGAVTDNAANKPNILFFFPDVAAGVELSSDLGSSRIVAASRDDQNSDSTTVTNHDDSYHRYVIKYTESSQADYYYDNTQATINTAGAVPPATRELHPSFQFNQADSGADQGIFADWIFVRKYASADPSVSTGSEQTSGQGVPEFKTWVWALTMLISLGFIYHFHRQIAASSRGV